MKKREARPAGGTARKAVESYGERLWERAGASENDGRGPPGYTRLWDGHVYQFSAHGSHAAFCQCGFRRAARPLGCFGLRCPDGHDADAPERKHHSGRNGRRVRSVPFGAAVPGHRQVSWGGCSNLNDESRHLGMDHHSHYSYIWPGNRFILRIFGC